MSDNEELFNFIPVNKETNPKPSQKTLGLSRKRGNKEPTVLQFVKKPVTRGSKIIKIEIYDADSFPKPEQLCDCEAELCAQHVVKTILFDDIYNSAKELITKIHDDIETRP